MVHSVELCSDVYQVCLTHALSTEKEEVMGLLMGELLENKVVHICSAFAMRRSDKQPDRVEISPEQLSAAAIEAEQLAAELKRPIQVLGWYHSHPHITVWPSHVDVSTQASYQLLDPNFVGLIFSCFNDTDKKKSRMQFICFQSVTRADSSLEHIELPIHIVPTPQATLSPCCVSALTHLPEILLEEEMESYAASQEHCTDLLSAVHNTGVYMQSLSHILQVMAAPLIQVLEEEIQRNKDKLDKLKRMHQQLSAIVSDSELDRV